MRAAGERHAHHPTQQTDHDGGAQRPHRQRRQQPGAVHPMVHTPQRADLVGHHGGHHTRPQRLMAQAANGQHLQPEHRARQRRAEHRGKARADARHQQDAPVVRAQAKHMRELIGQRPAHLNGRALAPHRGAKQVRHHRAQKNQRRHAHRHHLTWVMHLVDQQVVARLYRLAHMQVHPAHRESGQGQQGQQPAVRLARFGGPGQRQQKPGRSRAGQQGHAHAQRQPFQGMAQPAQGLGATRTVHESAPACIAHHLSCCWPPALP